MNEDTLLWVPKHELAQLLQLSTRSLEAHVASGVFQPGRDFYITGSGKTSRQIFNADLCRQALLEHTAKVFKGRVAIETYDQKQLARTAAKGAKK